MDDLIFFINRALFSGAVLGSIYALGAVGVTLIFGILRFAHFAHGDMMTLGAFIAYALAIIAAGLGISTFWPTGFIVLPLAIPLTVFAALLIDRSVYQPLRARGAVGSTRTCAPAATRCAGSVAGRSSTETRPLRQSSRARLQDTSPNASRTTRASVRSDCSTVTVTACTRQR